MVNIDGPTGAARTQIDQWNAEYAALNDRFQRLAAWYAANGTPRLDAIYNADYSGPVQRTIWTASVGFDVTRHDDGSFRLVRPTRVITTAIDDLRAILEFEDA